MTDLLKINLSLLSKFRTELMGFSAIGILMCHACGNNVAMPSSIWQICSLGQLGVSLFFLLSGMGLFYSLKKNDLVNKLGGCFIGIQLDLRSYLYLTSSWRYHTTCGLRSLNMAIGEVSSFVFQPLNFGELEEAFGLWGQLSHCISSFLGGISG